jgi:hypothetical protein
MRHHVASGICFQNRHGTSRHDFIGLQSPYMRGKELVRPPFYIEHIADDGRVKLRANDIEI